MKNSLLKPFLFAYFFFGVLVLTLIPIIIFTDQFAGRVSQTTWNLLALCAMLWFPILGIWFLCALIIRIVWGQPSFENPKSKLFFKILRIAIIGVIIIGILGTIWNFSTKEINPPVKFTKYN